MRPVHIPCLLQVDSMHEVRIPVNFQLKYVLMFHRFVHKDKMTAQKVAEKFLAFLAGDIDRNYISKQLGGI